MLEADGAEGEGVRSGGSDVRGGSCPERRASFSATSLTQTSTSEVWKNIGR